MVYGRFPNVQSSLTIHNKSRANLRISYYAHEINLIASVKYKINIEFPIQDSRLRTQNSCEISTTTWDRNKKGVIVGKVLIISTLTKKISTNYNNFM